MTGHQQDRPAPRGDPDDADPEDADLRLTSERTEMAWTRSSLAFAAVGIAIVKLRPAIGIPVLVFGIVVWLLGRLARPQGDRPGWLAARRALLVTVGICVLAAAALAIALAGPGAGGIRLR